MPGKVKVKIIAGRNLPVMDRSSDTTDAYVEIKLGNTTYKTDVCRKSLNPRWNSEWYRFEVDDAELQDEPLQIRLMDYDMYSANDSIGKVYLDLNPLLLPGRVGDSLSAAVNNTSGVAAVNGSGSIMSGWIPVYDTMHGIRGEVNITVKVKLFNDFNKFKQSSCGVQFFCSSIIPHGFHGQVIHGFVEELVVNDDPEYHWIDKIRTPRASNEARQTLFFKLSGEVQRKIGLKALDMGANAVIGYCQCFDLEGESGIVARGIGTAVTLVRLHENVDSTDPATSKEETVGGSAGACLSIGTTARDALTHNHHRTESVGGKGSKHNSIPSMNRRSSDSDLSITPKGNSFPNSDRAIGATGGPYNTMIRSGLKQEKWEMLEYPFLTMSKYPPGFITHIGGTVSTRSVKLLERISNPDEPESRDNWWTELRMEIRSHARALACNVVLGYCENTSICDDVCILSASGTAAVIGLQYGGRSDLSSETPVFLVRIQETDKVKSSGDSPKTSSNCSKDEKSLTATTNPDSSIQTCAICHIPYCESSVPFAVTMIKCAVCKHGNVPNILITTIEIPDEALTVGKGCLIQANVCRPKRDLRGEMNAKEISDGLPFLEFDLHRLVINKLKVKGMNAIFGLKVRVSIGERLLVGTATGTGVFLLPLPAPSFPKLVSGNSNTSDKKLSEMQKLLNDTINRNKEVYHLKNVQGDLEDHLNSLILASKAEETDDEILKMDITSGNKDTSVLELDDTEDIELISVLMESCPPEGFYVVNTETIPGLEDLEVKNLQMFKQMSRVKLQSHQCPSGSGKQFHRLLQTVYFKLRRMVPCALCHLQFRVDIPEQDEIQLTILGTVLGFTKVQKVKTKRKITNSISKEIVKKSEDADEIFSLEEDEIQNNEINEANSQVSKSPLYSSSHLNYKNNANMRHGIDITALSYIPGAKIKQYLGNLNFFFIRESTSIREGCGLSGFVHSFGTEVLAIVRAHISALGGNAMVGYFMTECVLFHNPHKNQIWYFENFGRSNRYLEALCVVGPITDCLKVKSYISG